MARTCVRLELPEKYNERERKLGRSKSATYREDGDDWILVVDLLKAKKRER